VDNTPGDKLGVWRDMRLADALVYINSYFYFILAINMQRHLHVVDVTAFVAETHDHILKRLLIGNPTATRT